MRWQRPPRSRGPTTAIPLPPSWNAGGWTKAGGGDESGARTSPRRHTLARWGWSTTTCATVAGGSSVSMTSGAMDYVELHCHSYYSLLDGTSSPADLVSRAADLGMDALALTDHDAVYGAVPFVTAARARGIRPILGAELTLEDGHHLTLLVENAAGWRNLCLLISCARMRMPKGQAALPWADLERHTAGLIALSGCRRGPVAAALLRWDRTTAFRMARRLRELFGPTRCWIELQHHLR